MQTKSCALPRYARGYKSQKEMPSKQGEWASTDIEVWPLFNASCLMWMKTSYVGILVRQHLVSVRCETTLINKQWSCLMCLNDSEMNKPQLISFSRMSSCKRIKVLTTIYYQGK